MEERPSVRIEYISTTLGGYVLVRQLNQAPLLLGKQPMLADVAISRTVQQPRALTEDGRPDLAVFALHPLRKSDLARLTVGQVVELSDAATATD
jgi:hypothetical protein